MTNNVSLRASYTSLKRMIHVLRGDDFLQNVQIERQILCLGNKGAQWCLCPEGLSGETIVYSFGVGEDISFDLELIRQFGVRVHAFDPTPRSIQWVREQAIPPEFVFHEYGVADFDGTCQFTPPENSAHVSYSLIRKTDSRHAVQAPVHRLTTIMKELGHDHIDVLKMDIEGAEYGVIGDLLASDIRLQQLLVEFHHRWREVGVDRTKHAIQELNERGYRIFNASPGGEEYSFLRLM